MFHRWILPIYKRGSEKIRRTGDERMKHEDALLFSHTHSLPTLAKLASSVRFESDKLMIVFPELYMAYEFARSALPPRSTSSIIGLLEWRVEGKKGRVGMLEGEEGRMGEREARKNIISTQHGGSHFARSLRAGCIRRRRQTSCVACSIDRAGWLLWVTVQNKSIISSDCS